MTLHIGSCTLQSFNPLKKPTQSGQHIKWIKTTEKQRRKCKLVLIWFTSKWHHHFPGRKEGTGIHRQHLLTQVVEHCGSHAHGLTVSLLLLSDRYISFKRYFQRVQDILIGSIYGWLGLFFLDKQKWIWGSNHIKKVIRDTVGVTFFKKSYGVTYCLA